MKAFVLIVLISLIGSVFAAETTEEKTEDANWWMCSCSYTDANRGHYYGASNSSAEDARQKAENNCWRSSNDPGTCVVASYDRCGCN